MSREYSRPSTVDRVFPAEYCEKCEYLVWLNRVCGRVVVGQCVGSMESARVANVLDRTKSMRPTFSYSSPCEYSLCERPIAFPSDESPAALTAHHSRQLLRLLLAKPALLSFNIANEQSLEVLYTAFDPTNVDSVPGMSGVGYMNRVLFNCELADKLFVELFQRWCHIFYTHRRQINWTRLYEDGRLRLLSASAVSENATAGDRLEKLNNDKLLRMYERFAGDVRKLVFRFGNRILQAVTPQGRDAILYFNALFKADLDSPDLRMICLLLYDLVDLLENVCVETRDFYTDSDFLAVQFVQARRELAFQRVHVFRRLVEHHSGFSDMRDWLYFRDNTLTPVEVR